MDRRGFLEEIRKHGSDQDVAVAERVFAWVD